MIFSTPIFIFLFLPVFLIAYWAVFLPYRITGRPSLLILCNLFLLLGSLVFYFWGQTWFVFLMMGSATLDYICGRLIDHVRNNRRFPKARSEALAKAFFLISITGNLTILFVFKYFNFAVNTANRISATLFGINNPFSQAAYIILPLGISFYTFKTMSYVIDVYLGNAKAEKSYLNYLCYVSMFMQLVAGPIVRYRDVAGQFIKRVVTSRSFSSGVERFIIGLGKKILIANRMAAVADGVFAVPPGSLPPGMAWLGAVSYTLQIYYDFSGYSDMAIGLGRMLGFDFLENFNYPYAARSIKDFWRRWHISLSSWLYDYLYTPVAFKNRSRGKRGVIFALLVTFFVCGLWHGASVKFIAWGLFYGVFLSLETGAIGEFMNRAWRPVRHIYTLLIVTVGWVLFRADSLSGAVSYLKSMLGFGGDGSAALGAVYITNETLLIYFIGVLGCMPIGRGIRKACSDFTAQARTGSAAFWRLAVFFPSYTMLIGIFAASVMSLAAETFNPFVYLRF